MSGHQQGKDNSKGKKNRNPKRREKRTDRKKKKKQDKQETVAGADVDCGPSKNTSPAKSPEYPLFYGSSWLFVPVVTSPPPPRVVNRRGGFFFLAREGENKKDVVVVGRESGREPGRCGAH